MGITVAGSWTFTSPIPTHPIMNLTALFDGKEDTCTTIQSQMPDENPTPSLKLHVNLTLPRQLNDTIIIRMKFKGKILLGLQFE